MAGDHYTGAPLPTNGPPSQGQPPPVHVVQSWSFALFALLTTAAIITAALAAPLLFDSLAGQLFAGSQEVIAPAIVTWGHLLSFQAAVVVLTVLMAGVARGAAPTLGWQAPRGRLSWLQPLWVTIAVSAVTAAIAFVFFADIVARDLAPVRKMIDAAPLWIAFVALAFGAPLSEELLFRGYLLHRLVQTRLGFWSSALITNTGWTLLHFNYSWLSLADVFLAGLLFSWALWRTKSIWVPIAFHAIYNATVFFFLLIPSSAASASAFW